LRSVSESYDRYGWLSDLGKFTEAEPKAVRSLLQDFVAGASSEQVRAWDQSIPWLQRECRELLARDSAKRGYTTILEYELPRELRRPDVIVLSRGHVVVLEIKGYASATQAAVDQAFGYARDLAAYHAACAGRPVVPVLAIRGTDLRPHLRDGVWITSPEFVDQLVDRFSDPDASIVPVAEFLSDDVYRPLPTIVQAARDLFQKRDLPHIKRARASTDPALDCITKIAHDAARTGSRRLVLLSGVPGSGKTLVGLQLVHAGWVDDLAVARSGVKPTAPAVYLSGNAPLVAVLQDALRDAGGGGRTFVQGIKTYVEHHARRRTVPSEHLIVFDEAQRAHDAERVAKVHKAPITKSEPAHLIDFCQRIPEWCVLVALIGDGQAIHQGEEGGIGLWADALRASVATSPWIVHGPQRLLDAFEGSSGSVVADEALNLDKEIRFHLTPRVHKFVEGLLSNSPIDDLARTAGELNDGGHRFLITRSLEDAVAYLRERYAGSPNARYGLLASSKDKWLTSFGVDNSYWTTQRLRVGPWYNAPPDDEQSCCALAAVATEFSSQGLELDFALVAWGSDLTWSGGGWSIEHSRGTQGTVHDPLAMRKNVYRVLMTRGRDGTVVFVPPDGRFDVTHSHLVASGFRPLESQIATVA
jgi:hypothetical protein